MKIEMKLRFWYLVIEYKKFGVGNLNLVYNTNLSSL